MKWSHQRWQWQDYATNYDKEIKKMTVPTYNVFDFIGKKSPAKVHKRWATSRVQMDSTRYHQYPCVGRFALLEA